MASTKSAYPPLRVHSIEYKRPTALLLLSILTLYPSPSPLFYITCLPALILLHRHDSRQFILCTVICVGLVSLTAELRGGKEIGFAGVHCLMVVGNVVGSVVVHHRFPDFIKRTAWSDSLLFALLWTSCGIISRAIKQVSLITKSGELMNRTPLHPPVLAMNPSVTFPKSRRDRGRLTTLNHFIYGIHDAFSILPSSYCSRSRVLGVDPNDPY